MRGNVGVISGGGINNKAVMNIDHSTISANEGDEHGGGISNGGTLEVAESTVSGNFTLGERQGDAGAGIYHAAGSLTVTFSTVAFNQGSGIANVSSTLTTLSDTILAGNKALYENAAGLLPFDCFGTFRSLGHNLIGAADPRSTCVVTVSRNDQIGFDRAAPIDAKLAELAANGGFTQTHALLDGSPAINHAARLLEVAKRINHDIVASENFAQAAKDFPFESLGIHALRDIDGDQRVFGIDGDHG